MIKSYWRYIQITEKTMIKGINMEINCKLAAECDCELCQYWGENGWDLSRTPEWQRPKPDEDEQKCKNFEDVVKI